MDASMSPTLIEHLAHKYNDTQPQRTSHLLSSTYHRLNGEIQEATGLTREQVHDYYRKAKQLVFRSRHRLIRENEGYYEPYLTKEVVGWFAQKNLADYFEKKLSAQTGKKLELEWKVVDCVDMPRNYVPEEKRNGKWEGGVWEESTEFMEWVEQEEMRKEWETVGMMEKLAAAHASDKTPDRINKTGDTKHDNNSSPATNRKKASSCADNVISNPPSTPKRKKPAQGLTTPDRPTYSIEPPEAPKKRKRVYSPSSSDNDIPNPQGSPKRKRRALFATISRPLFTTPSSALPFTSGRPSAPIAPSTPRNGNETATTFAAVGDLSIEPPTPRTR